MYDEILFEHIGTLFCVGKTLVPLCVQIAGVGISSYIIFLTPQGIPPDWCVPGLNFLTSALGYLRTDTLESRKGIKRIDS